MNNVDKQYLELCSNILINGNRKQDRTGTGTLSLFGNQIRIDLSKGFPLLTTKKVHFKSIVGELLWFLKGTGNIKFLKDNNIKIWDAWASDRGSVGPMYGSQWRDFNGDDQIEHLIYQLKTNPDSRRMLVSAWNPEYLPIDHHSPQENVDLGYMALAPCHYSFQCYVDNGKLSMLVNQRSADLFLGVPFNLASYALLTHMLAQVCELKVGELIWNGGDVHIYSNHVDQVKEQIARHTRGEVFELPTINLNKDITDIDDFTYEDIELINYQSGSAIKGAVAI